MKSYTYKFADGTTSTVEVEDSLYEILTEMDKQEKYGNRRETRRHVSLDQLVEQGVEPTVNNGCIIDEILGQIEDWGLSDIISVMTSAQKRLIKQIYVEGLSQQEIAEIEGVKQQAISNRLRKIHRKIQRYFD